MPPADAQQWTDGGLMPQTQAEPPTVQHTPQAAERTLTEVNSPLSSKLPELHPYLRFLARLKAAWTDCPNVEVAFKNLSVTFAAPVGSSSGSRKHKKHHAHTAGSHYTIPTVANQAAHYCKLPFALAARRLGVTAEPRRYALRDVSGVIRPGSMTLVLAPPGHGKSSFLKALCGRLAPSGVHGSLTYNGRSMSELAADGVQVKRLSAYVGQADFHFPALTVRETVTFAAQSSVADASLLKNASGIADPELSALEARRADMLIDLIGLSECVDTFVGNDMLRGVSGGQRKRVTLAEMMVSNARLLCLDEVSTGLDAAVTQSFFSSLQSICRLNGSSVVATLLQPTPDTYGLFDDILLLHDGEVLFHGPRADVQRWLWQVCGVDCPATVDEASFLMDFLVNPTMAYESAQILAQTEAFAKATRMEREASETAAVRQSRLAGAAAAGMGQQAHEEKQQNGSDPAAALFSPASYTLATRPEVYQFPTYSSQHAVGGASQQPQQQQLSNGVIAAERDPSHVKLHLDYAEEEEEEEEEEQQQEAPAPASAAQTSTPPQQQQQQLQQPLNRGSHDSAEPGSSATAVVQSKVKRLSSQPQHSTAPVPPVRDMADLHERYRRTHWHQLQTQHKAGELLKPGEGDLFKPTPLDPSRWSAYTLASFASATPHAPRRHMALCWSRQWKLFVRAVTIMVPRMAKAFLIGLCYGLLFFQLSDTQFTEKLAVVMYAGIFAAMTNLSELPVASEARNVISKQLDSGFYRASPYTVAACAMHVPVTLVESLCYSTLFYFLAGLEYDGGRFLFHLLLCVLASNCMAVMYRFISYVTPNPDIARQLDLPFVVLFIIMNAYLVAYSQIPVWLANSAYWISPLSWTTRSLAINEYSADKYDVPSPTDPSQRVGDTYLAAFDLQTGMVWKWMGVVYLIGWMIVWMAICTASLNRVGLVGPQGSERDHYQDVEEKLTNNNNKNKKKLLGHDAGAVAATSADAQPKQSVDIELGLACSPSPPDGVMVVADDDCDDDECSLESPITPDVLMAIDGAQEDVQQEIAKQNPRVVPAPKQLALSALPFTPATLSWQDLNYSVTLPNGKERVLLAGISGFGAPGQMTALMGASGAGKTTLMDCCAGRKTTGKLNGQVLLNGSPVDIHSDAFQKMCGYVEQENLHIGTATVEEALRFSAFLRLPVVVPLETQHEFVREVLALLGLTPFAHHLIGDAAIPGLGPAQLKLVTIGVELVANPAILFLDEPTSGLDSPAAWRVMTAIKRIAMTGRTIITTVHQPSARLFYLFDRLLLLQPGGHTIYNHTIGRRGEHLISYLEAASGFELQLPEGSNPADFALGLRTEAEDKGTANDWGVKWTNSRVNQQEVLPLIAQFTNPATFASAPGAVVPKNDAAEALVFASWGQRFWAVQKRLLVSYWRNSPMNLTRFVIAVVLGFLIGLTYYGVEPNSFAGVNSFLAGTFMAVLFGPSLSAIAALPTMFRQRPVYYRESTVRMYDANVYQLTLTVAELFSLAFLMLVYTLPHYYLMGLNSNSIQFLRFFFAVFLMAQVYASLAQAYLAFLPNQVAAAVVHAIMFAFFFVFGGLLITAKHYPDGFRWFYAMIPTPKAYIAMALGQLSCSDAEALSGGAGCGFITTPEGQTVQVYEYVSGQLENSADSYGNQIGWLILIIAVIKIVTALGFRFISHLKR